MVLKTVSAFPDILSYCVGTSELGLKLSTLRLSFFIDLTSTLLPTVILVSVLCLPSYCFFVASLGFLNICICLFMELLLKFQHSLQFQLKV